MRNPQDRNPQNRFKAGERRAEGGTRAQARRRTAQRDSGDGEAGTRTRARAHAASRPQQRWGRGRTRGRLGR